LGYAVFSVFPGNGASGGVAFFAHVGGFVFGMIFTWIFMRLVPQAPAEQRRDVLYDRAARYRY
jgi:membrane associated rhomboid family serine protease